MSTQLQDESVIPNSYFNRETETASRDTIMKLQMQKFQEMLPVIWAGNSFYRKKWRSVGLDGPEDIRGWDDFRKLPFTLKSELAEDQLKKPPFGTNLTYPMDKSSLLHLN